MQEETDEPKKQENQTLNQVKSQMLSFFNDTKKKMANMKMPTMTPTKNTSAAAQDNQDTSK